MQVAMYGVQYFSISNTGSNWTGWNWFTLVRGGLGRRQVVLRMEAQGIDQVRCRCRKLAVVKKAIPLLLV